MIGKLTRIALPVASMLFVGACTLDDSLSLVDETDQAASPSVAVDAPEWTAGIIDRSRPDLSVTRLVAVRTGTLEGFDQVIFEFDERVPGYHTQYIDQPVRKCGSGKVTHLAGDGWLELRMYPAKAHSEEGKPTITDRERRPNLPLLSELELTCDFEAVVTWVFGVESPNRYRVRELSSPPRLVIELRHNQNHSN